MNNPIRSDTLTIFTWVVDSNQMKKFLHICSQTSYWLASTFGVVGDCDHEHISQVDPATREFDCQCN